MPGVSRAARGRATRAAALAPRRERSPSSRTRRCRMSWPIRTRTGSSRAARGRHVSVTAAAGVPEPGARTARPLPSRAAARARARVLGALAVAALAAPLVPAAPAVAAPPPPCLTSDLALSWAPGGTAVSGGAEPGSIRTAVVDLRNGGSGTCLLDGFPKVTLARGASTENLLDQQSAPHSAVVLEPGAGARFTLTFRQGQPGQGGAIEPVTAIVTPPNNTASTNMRWRWGPVAEQVPGDPPRNFVGPVVSV
ncbi:DUF4232 domain-containing protein [Streptomyces spongiicola]|uniref:DUF4232 domain-containing protein n=1 Tax=Streptomyces spongiicola TaxID=1690221 RepID=UPI0033FFBCBC